MCNTTYLNTNCSRGSDGGSAGEWYFPNGQIVPGGLQGELTSTRFTHQVRLNRRDNAFSPTGVYECRVPDENNQTIITASVNITGPG